MADRPGSWLKQAQRDLAHARGALDASFYEWACFAAQQAAEKAVKAVYLRAGGVAWGHSVTVLLESLPRDLRPDEDMVDAAKELDRHYVPSRYPNAHPGGAPYEYYTRKEAERAVDYCDGIIRFCAGVLARPVEGGGASSEGR